ncbi:MAG: nucleotide pyrophosphohydrolase [Candidatus Methanomethylophilaceae archaeon]|jgi:NTP pyrophosphatase (non-canonical NTP hydrolase)|nr:nucleotide pyrophosphohydrolase [Candidatus Methanomethylophilaceae archaeon]NCA74003.1 nucleotide pyrophosphohydrolase [Gammaproteobacteria bacterium]MDD3351566.1 nucleotide pyrophosphohydrolase [Candidatus Methanomethylophilaceae archaeon]MDD3986846.1 nucleotide pyrophosphohydrolase [Candidatus Methanomethylophilaceae archaeon]MDD4709330.1 nucleotide pyrophosphohydrolase [Candidatus Methanomethylophilaceae archaeon]
MRDFTATVDELKTVVRMFCEDREWDRFHNPKDLAIGITTEASELLDIFRFKDAAECREILEDEECREAVCDELADVLYFVLRFAQTNDIDLASALESKVYKNGKKYPADKSRGSNKKYDEL